MKRVVLQLVLVACLAAVFSAAGCDRTTPNAPRFAASRVTSAFGLNVSVFVSKQQIGVADRLELLVEARRERGDEQVAWPSSLADAAAGKPFPPQQDLSAPGDWTVLEASRRVLAPGHEILELVLEPYLPGEKPIPSFQFEIERQSVTTEPIPVSVVSERREVQSAQDPLAGLPNLDGALRPAPRPRPWLQEPSTWALLGGGGVLVLAGGAAVLGRRYSRRRTQSPDQILDSKLADLRDTAASGTDRDAAALVEHSISALRQWLAATRGVSVATTGPELASWLSARPGAAAGELAAHLLARDRDRFAPAGSVDLAAARALLNCIAAFVAACRVIDCESPATGGGDA